MAKSVKYRFVSAIEGYALNMAPRPHRVIQTNTGSFLEGQAQKISKLVDSLESDA